VVGGKNSNNTRQVCHQAELRKVPCFHVQDEHDLDAEALLQFEVVGLTAGTSTPDSTINGVHEALKRMGMPEAAHTNIRTGGVTVQSLTH
jgi:4-hydroxy-3-methylbut-2-enyl diphosphate reductase